MRPGHHKPAVVERGNGRLHLAADGDRIDFEIEPHCRAVGIEQPRADGSAFEGSIGAVAGLVDDDEAAVRQSGDIRRLLCSCGGAVDDEFAVNWRSIVSEYASAGFQSSRVVERDDETSAC